MHSYTSEAEFLASVSGFLGFFYLCAALMNGVAALFAWSHRRQTSESRNPALPLGDYWIWSFLTLLFLAMTGLAFSADPRLLRLISFPAFFRDAMDRMLGPTVFVAGVSATLLCLYWGRRFFTLPAVAFGGLNLAILFMGLSMTDRDFFAIVSKPDNVPIVGMIFLLGYFTWLSVRRAVINDARLARGQPPQEAEENEKVLVWPDLVYIELICMVALTALLIFWSIAIKAPLEGHASTAQTPNPSKAPWYFLGLQEMLVYFDPWMAGVVLPSLIIIGLMAIPYLDFNKRGNGYYTISQRKFAYLSFQFGFLVLWITLMLMGTFLRGPNWSFFGIYETWDAHKVAALTNVKLSERFWIELLGLPLPEAPPGAGWLSKIGGITLRELPGLVVLGAYFIALPAALARYVKTFRAMFLQMGLSRYVVMSVLLLIMLLLPIKMICRWAFNMNYIVSIPEYSFNL